MRIRHHHTPKTARALLSSLCGLALITVGVSRAQEVEQIEHRLTLRIGASHSDNLGRDFDEQLIESETFAVAGLDIGALRDNRRLRAYIDGSADYHRYNSDRFGNETLGQIRAGLDVRVVPNLFTWEFADRVGHVRRDPYSSPSPENRDRLNVFSTGPVLDIPVGEMSTLGISARHEDRRWRDDDGLNSESRYADLSFFRRLSQARRVGFTFGSRRTEYDRAVADSYDVETAYITYDRTLSAGTFSVSAGANRLKLADGRDTSPYYQASLRRRFAAYSALTLSFSREVQDSAGQLGGRRQDSEFLDGIGDVPLTTTPLTLTRGGIDYSLTRPRTTYGFSTDWTRQRFSGEPELDRNGWSGRASVSFRFSRGTIGNLAAAYGREEFGQQFGRARTSSVEAGLERSLNRDLSLNLRYRYYKRDSASDMDFSENVTSLVLVWSPRQ